MSYEFHVRGEVPSELNGFLLVAMSRRLKNRAAFARWHDSQADLLRLDLLPGRPGRVLGHIFPVDPSGVDVGESFRRSQFDTKAYGKSAAYGYATQPNHGLNVAHGKVWCTNLLFGAPLEMDVREWQAKRILRYVDPEDQAPRLSTTSHFAWTPDGRYAYFHQSLLARQTKDQPVLARNLKLIRLDTASGRERVWDLLPPRDDNLPEAMNFHSAFYWEESDRKYVGLLRTGAVLESIEPHPHETEHDVLPMPTSSIWMMEIDDTKNTLQASLLPGARELGGLAISHLDVDVSKGEGFVLYANYKQSDVAEETHGLNIYGQHPEEIAEHYSGMIVEAINIGKLIRYERRNGEYQVSLFEQEYEHGSTSLGHTWLPINIELDSSRAYLYCTFSGFRPRLLPRHIVKAYHQETINSQRVRDVPPLLMRFDAKTLRPDYDRDRTYLSYDTPPAIAVVGDYSTGYVCTFAPESGLCIYRAADLRDKVCHALSHEIWHWEDTHFRPPPAHMVFVRD